MERETIVQRTLLVDASPQAIWKALTEPQLTKLYMDGLQARSTWARGASITWVERNDEGETVRWKGVVKENMPGHRLRYDCLKLDGDLPDEPASYTTVDISVDIDREGRSRLVLWHGDFAGLPHDVRRTREAGRRWVEALVGLKRVAEEVQQMLAA